MQLLREKKEKNKSDLSTKKGLKTKKVKKYLLNMNFLNCNTSNCVLNLKFKVYDQRCRTKFI